MLIVPVRIPRSLSAKSRTVFSIFGFQSFMSRPASIVRSIQRTLAPARELLHWSRTNPAGVSRNEHSATPHRSGTDQAARWLPGNVQYETIMGSVAYGVSSDTSDVDVYGWAIPPKDDLSPTFEARCRLRHARSPL